jgi:sulfide dehydrogenase cytochrome subunit
MLAAAQRRRVWREKMRTRKVVLALALTASAAVIARAAEAPPGAAACSGCHAQIPGLVPSLMGREAAEVTTAMLEFRSGARPATVMGRIAKGFSEDEIRAIAAWLAVQK